MTVAELIDVLQQLERHGARVVVDGYEGGYDDIASIRSVRTNLAAPPGVQDWYWGRYPKNNGSDEVVLISGRSYGD